MISKQKVHEAYAALVIAKITALKSQLSDLSNSAANETKSTAGDKYETSRAMLQIEQDNVRSQLQQVLEQKAMLDMSFPNQVSITVERGSLVETNLGWLFISAALGKLKVDEIVITAISPQSPLGSRLMGCRVGDYVPMNQLEYAIKTVL